MIDVAAMVRRYVRKRAPVYMTEALQAATNMVLRERKSCRAVAMRFNIPPTTLYNHVKKNKGCTIGAGHPTVLSQKEEEEIVAAIQALQEIGFALTKELVSIVIRDYLKDQDYRPNPFKNCLPGKDWWQLFLKRWNSEISIRKPQHLPASRAACATEEVIDAWFTRVKNVLNKSGLESVTNEELSCRIWNCDETGFSTAVASVTTSQC